MGNIKNIKERGKMFDGSTAHQLFVYMLDRVVNAPTAIHRNSSVILIMPYFRQKLRESDERKEKCRDISNK